MKGKLWTLVTVLVVLSLGLSACAPKATPAPTPVPTAKPAATPTPPPAAPVTVEDEWGVVEVAAGEPIRIGFAAALSGAGVDVLGIDELRGAELAVKDKPEIKGFQVELVVDDEMCSAEGGQTVANKFVADPTIVALVGHMCSSSCLPASKIYEQHHYSMVSPSCTGVSLTVPDADATEVFNRVCWSDKIQGPAAAEFVKDVLGIDKVATIHDGSPYAEQLAAEFVTGFEALGGQIVGREAVNVGDTDMRPVLTRLKAGDPELIYAPIFPAEGGYLAAQRADVGMEGVIFMGADGIMADVFIEAAGDLAEGVYASAGNFAEAGPALPKFLEAYKAAYGEDPIAPFHAHAYDAFMVIANAVEKVAVEDGEGNLLIGRKALRDAIRATSGYQGLSGKISCDENGDCGSGSVSFSVVKGGVWASAEAPAPAELGKIVIGNNAEYPPFEMVDEAGNIVGFDADLMEAIAEAAGFEFELVNTRWDGIFVALASGEFDAVISAATITEERAQIVDFSDPYFNAGQVIAVRADETAIKTDADLAGKKVGVQLGTTGDIWLTDETDAEVVRYDENTLAFQALAAGDVDAAVADSTTAIDIVKANPEMKLKVLDGVYTDEYYGIAVNKDRPELLAAINAGLAAVKASGKYDEIYDKWFGVPEAGLLVVSAPCESNKMKEIAALDDMTVRFTLCKPDPAFLSKAAFTPFFIQPREWIEAKAGTTELLEHPIGTGPYYIESWNRGDSIVFKRFDDYWGEPAVAETLVFRWATEGAARLLELQAGTVDHIVKLSPDDYEAVRGDPSLQFLPVPNPNIMYLAMTSELDPFGDEPGGPTIFADVRVRKAIAMGIDRQRIVDNFYPAGSVAASHFTPCSIPNGCQGEEWYEFDPEAARALLAEAGYPDGFKTAIYYRDVFRVYLPEPGLVAQDIQAQLKENLNIDAEVIVMESGEFIDESTNGRLDGLYMLGWGADYLHVTNFLDFHFSRSNPQFGEPHPEIYEILEKASTIADEATTAPMYEEANNNIKELVPMVPIAHGAPADAARADVEGAHTAVLGPPSLWKVNPGGRDTLIYLKAAEPISLYCMDETDGESLDACKMVTEGLYKYDEFGVAQPTLATSCEANEDATVYTCYLREGVKFHDGSTLDANDVVRSWDAGLNAASPYHIGNTGAFEYPSYLFDALMNLE